MTRHSKNNTASSVFTYAEREMLKYGTQRKRLGRDSMRDYDACFLCLHTVRDPLCCPQGHLGCKECFYENILAQKREIARNIKLAEEQQKAEQASSNGAQAQQALIKEFEGAQMSTNKSTPASSNGESPFSREETSERKVFRMTAEDITARQEMERQRTIEQMDKVTAEKNKAKLPSFWIPHLTPEVKTNSVDTSKTQPTCTGSSPPHPIGIKKLIPVKFTYLTDKQERNPDDDDNVTTAEERRQSAVCPSCSKSLTNSMKLILSKQCGHVLCSGCVDKFVKPSKQCFVCEKKCKDKDMVTLKSEGTGFAAGGGKVQVTKYETAFIG
ncbi:hypothetical protein BDF22DRAFT_742051 [Syncephalis plumigaleata]|nr:hypothetical protein BDF22DRAFT_742051 [Syncephalis plumigaleata]